MGRQANATSLLGTVAPPGEEHLLGGRKAHGFEQSPRLDDAVYVAQARCRYGEIGGLVCDAEVARERQSDSSPVAGSRDCRDGGLGTGGDCGLAAAAGSLVGASVLDRVAHRRKLRDVGACGERAASAGYDDSSHRGIRAKVGEDAA